MTVIALEAERSKHDRPSRLAVPPDLPPFTTMVLILFRGLGDIPFRHVARYFRVTPAGLEPLGTVFAGDFWSVRASIPAGFTRLSDGGARHPKAYEIWLPPLGYGLEPSPPEPR